MPEPLFDGETAAEKPAGKPKAAASAQSIMEIAQLDEARVEKVTSFELPSSSSEQSSAIADQRAADIPIAAETDTTQKQPASEGSQMTK